ncbi:MAG: UbiA family prenyltransferase, partial [Pseudomonadota bacterium]
RSGEGVDVARPRTQHIGRQPDTLRAYVKSLRPHQWLKNILVFLPMLAAHQLDAGTFLMSLLAFIAFSMIASSVYVFNDLLDLRADRAHPRKRLRPFASGLLPLSTGAGLGLALLASGCMVALALGPAFFGVMLAYFAITLAYSLRLKRLMVVDICALAVLYTLRIIAGGAATDIPISVWLIAFALFLFFSLAAVKRQAELVDDAARAQPGSDGKIAGRGYHVDDLPVISQMALASGFVAVLVMALYVNSPSVSGLYDQPAALWGICLILLFWISRVVLLTHRGEMDDDPVVFAVRDRTSQVCGLLVLLCAGGGAVLG